MEKHVEFHARFEWGQSFLHDGERGSLRGKRDCRNKPGSQSEPNDLGEIHPSSFDFTLGTA